MISVNKAKFQNLDKWLVAAVCVLSIFGIICIGSALHVNLGEDPSNYYSQMVFFATGLVIMFIVAFFDIDYLSRFDRTLYIVNILIKPCLEVVGNEQVFYS